MNLNKNHFEAGSTKIHFWNQEYEYRSFVPAQVNNTYDWSDRRIPVLLEEAVRLVGELNAYSTLVPNVDFFIQMHVKNEAVKSSRIEGTRTEMDDIILPEADISPEKRNDWKEVQNYISAMNFAVERLKSLPISMRLLQESHKILLTDVRGQNKNPGELRRSQNWIGGANIMSATFIPPHPDDLPDSLKDLEYFWHNKNLNMPHLIKMAISHYQFETIHPFLDGNGRIGRLLMTLHLMELGLLQKPTLYLSDFFEKNKGQYYDSLTFVRTQNDLDQWILFFLGAVIETAKKGRLTFQKIIDLRGSYEKQIMLLGKRSNIAYNLLITLFSEPATNAIDTSKRLSISISSANSLLNELSRLKILKEVTGFSRNRTFVLYEYIDLFRG